jgi:hypothetical protein
MKDGTLAGVIAIKKKIAVRLVLVNMRTMAVKKNVFVNMECGDILMDTASLVDSIVQSYHTVKVKMKPFPAVRVIAANPIAMVGLVTVFTVMKDALVLMVSLELKGSADHTMNVKIKNAQKMHILKVALKKMLQGAAITCLVYVT